MSPIPPSAHKTQRWDGLPAEIRHMILWALVQDGQCKLAPLTTVSREWQVELERHTFARIKLTPSRLADFHSMVHRNRALVGYIWFCLELDDYDCTKCAPGQVPPRPNLDELAELLDTSDTDKCPITASFHNLFSVLSTWEDPRGGLTLDISIYSPSDPEIWLNFLNFDDDDVDDPQHGWVAGSRHTAPHRWAFHKVFNVVMEPGPFDSDDAEFEWWDQLPSVPAVTSLLLRQQNHRRWNPNALAHMLARFPRLQEVHYELWRGWCRFQRPTDKEYHNLFESIQRANIHLKRLVVFENFHQQYPAILQRLLNVEEMEKCESIRDPHPVVGRMVAIASLQLEHLAASFIVDAGHFFAIEPSWEWPKLTSLVLTSNVLRPGEDPVQMEAMLHAAAAAAMRMPRLETMEIWNGRKGLAAAFQYQTLPNARRATVTWRATWAWTMEPLLIRVWEAVIHHRYDDTWSLAVAQEQLDTAAIKSPGDAIPCLRLSGQVIRPVSLQQIQMEQKSLEGARTV
ncbi:hypothetical protein B0T22DRAFT_459394 [Podospora appendiculata]|uniref:DUF6546 domain-containing protein n=1 Tax=Podospora appendiculata TaxID=314037 RepID=A0AAE0X989_9PEZI|nr:hypothetical protein B0T22DRAFT_459394 [Podospora appendiculata]